MTSKRKQSNYRLSEAAKAKLRKLATAMETTQTHALEVIIRKFKL